jgi:hypothetical protein
MANYRLPAGGEFSLSEAFSGEALKAALIRGGSGGVVVGSVRLIARQIPMQSKDEKTGEVTDYSWLQGPAKAVLGIVGGPLAEAIHPEVGIGVGVGLLSEGIADIMVAAWDYAAKKLAEDDARGADPAAAAAGAGAGTQGLGRRVEFRLPPPRPTGGAVAGLGAPHVLRQTPTGFAGTKVTKVGRFKPEMAVAIA